MYFSANRVIIKSRGDNMIFESDSDYKIHSLGKFVWGNTTINYSDSPRKKHGIILVNGGTFVFSTEDAALTAKTGDLVYLPQGSCYTVKIINGENYLINFENNCLAFKSPIMLIAESKNKYRNLFEGIIEMGVKGESNFLLKSQFYVLLDNITKDSYGTKGEKTFLENVKMLLESDENYSVKEIAKKCAICESGLRKLFKSTYGISPIEYKFKFKINKAKFLLESSTLNVAEISEKLGFYDAAYFTKAFKKQVGCTPTEYIKRKSL